MRTIRRLYFYLVALISLEVVVWGAIGLLRSIFSGSLSNTTETLAQALSLVLVGVPVFGVHWYFAQKFAGSDDEERSSALRALFIYLALLFTLTPVAQNLLALINRSLIVLAGFNRSHAILGGGQTWQDNLIAVAINVLIAAYFLNVAHVDWRELGDVENFGWVRRLYRYLWVLYGLGLTVFGVEQLIHFLFYVPAGMLGQPDREIFVNAVSLLIVGLPVWIYCWMLCQNALSESGEQGSHLRLAVLYLLSLGGVITVLVSAAMALAAILRWIVGVPVVMYDFLQQIENPVAVGLPLAGVWAYYGNWLKREIDSVPEAQTRSGRWRLYLYILSFIGFGASLTGVSVLIALIIDLTTGHALWGDALRAQLSGSLAALAASLPLWLRTWLPVQSAALEDGDAGIHARRSVVRRVYLYLMIFAGVIGGMTSAGMLAYTLLRTALTRHVDGDLLYTVLNQAQILILFALTLIYHLGNLRRDQSWTSDAMTVKESLFTVLVIDPGQGFPLRAVTDALHRQVPSVTVIVHPAGEAVPANVTEKARVCILPAGLAVDPPPTLRSWLKGFSGRKIAVTGSASGWLLTGLSPEQAAHAVRQLAEGQEDIRVGASVSGWLVVVYILAGLMGLEILFLLFGLFMSIILN
jgi:hypothetical protein